MSQFHLILSVLKVIPDSRFISVCNKIISHDRVDIITIEAWCNRIRFEQIFDNIEYIDSQPFYEHVMMQKKGVRKSNMSLIVHELGWSELMNFYDRNSYGALSDAETLCLLSTSESLIKRYLGWKHFQLLLRSNPFPVVSMRTQSVK